MIDVVGEYIRNLAVFMLFITFIGIVAPSEKYKSYINLIMGFMLIFIMVSPIINVMGSWDTVLEYLEEEVLRERMGTVHSLDISQAEDTKRNLIIDNVTQTLTPQIEAKVRNNNLEPTNININISTTQDNFLHIDSIHIEATEPRATGPIQIEIISPTANVEDPRILALKNDVAHFYNLSVNHIYVLVR